MIRENKIPEQYHRIQKILKRKKLDGTLAISMENVYWFSQSLILTQKSIPDRLAIVFIPADGEPVFLVCSIEESLVRKSSWISNIVSYEEFKDSPIEALTEILKQKGFNKGRIGLEKNYLCIHFFEELQRCMPNIHWEDFSKDFEKERMIKTPREINILKKAAWYTEKAIIDAFAASQEGDSERSVLNRIILNTLDAGGVGANGSFGTGEKSAIAHPIADETVLKKGDIVSVDFGAAFDGYYSDIGRTATVGNPPARKSSIYQKLYDVQRHCIDLVKPGVKACDIFKEAYNRLNQYGLELSLSHVGHGIGLIIHEEPMLSPFNEETLLENMVINIEPFYVTDEGYHSEDTMLITSDGVELFTTYKDHHDIIPISLVK